MKNTKEILMTTHTKNSDISACSLHLSLRPFQWMGMKRRLVSPDVKSIPAAEPNLLAIFYSTTRMKENSNLQKNRPLNFLLTAVSGFFHLLSSWALIQQLPSRVLILLLKIRGKGGGNKPSTLNSETRILILLESRLKEDKKQEHT